MLVRARRMMLAVAEGNAEEFGKYARALQRFDFSTVIDTTQTREVIAQAVIDRECYQIV
jgi:hypothetical protein